MRNLLILLMYVVLLASQAPAGESPAVRVLIKAKEFAYEPKEVTVQPGRVVFVVKNEGLIEHNSVIETPDRRKVAEIANLKPGETDELETQLRAGTYTIVCTLPGHRDAGMIAKLTVKF